MAYNDGGNWWGAKPKVGVSPTYQMLQVELMKSVDKEEAAAIMAFVRNEDDAYKLAGHEGYSYRRVDHHGRAGVLTKNGCEVALYWKRQVVQRELGPAEPIPTCVLKEPEDAWIRISLIKEEEATEYKGIHDRLKKSMAQVERLRLLWTSEKSKREELEGQAVKWLKDKEELSVLRDRTAVLETQLKAAEKEIVEGKKAVVEKERENRELHEDVVSEFFPIVNTFWLAGQHRVNDQLYGILQRMSIQALEKLEVELVEPKVGHEFDPTLHHAVHSHGFPEGAREIGTVTQVHKVGLKMKKGRVLFAAEVSVGVDATVAA